MHRLSSRVAHGGAALYHHGERIDRLAMTEVAAKFTAHLDSIP
jgi:hypothetical protein